MGEIIIRQRTTDEVKAEARAIGHEMARANLVTGGERFVAAMAVALAEGFAKQLGDMLAKLTLSDGPWLIHADGTIEATE